MVGLWVSGVGIPLLVCFCVLAFIVSFPLCIIFLSLRVLHFLLLSFFLSFLFHSAFLSSVMTIHGPSGLGDCIYLGRVYVSGSCFPLIQGGSGVILSSFGSGCEFGRSMRVSVQQWGFFFGSEKVAFYRFELVLGTLAKGTAGMPANHQKSYRSLIC